MRKRITNEKGKVMIESLIVYLVTFTLLFLILALLMVSYQWFTVKSVATEGGGDLRIASAFDSLSPKKVMCKVIRSIVFHSFFFVLML